MSYTLNCYANYEEMNVVNKTLPENPSLSLSCNLKYGLNERQPTLIVGCDITTLTQYNYFHIPELGRYYFKVDLIGVSNILCELSLDCDLLMTWKGQFLSSECIVERNENRGNTYVVDSVYPVESRTTTITKKFSKSLHDGESIILVTIG